MPCPGRPLDDERLEDAGDARPSQEELNGEELDSLEEAQLTLELLELEELEFELQYEEMQLQQLQAMEKADLEAKPSGTRPPATPCTSPTPPPSLLPLPACFLSGKDNAWLELRS